MYATFLEIIEMNIELIDIILDQGMNNESPMIKFIVNRHRFYFFIENA